LQGEVGDRIERTSAEAAERAQSTTTTEATESTTEPTETPKPPELHINEKQFGKKLGKHASDWGLNPSNVDDRSAFRTKIIEIVDDRDDVTRVIWYDKEEWAFRKGNDVVLVRDNGEFHTIMKDGADNRRLTNGAKDMQDKAWTSENLDAAEERWLELIRQEADKLGCVFVLDCGEGREMLNPPEGMYIQDMSGVLLTREQAELKPHKTREERDRIIEDPSQPLTMARWKATEDGGVAVVFETVPIYDD
jgi:hypothetical protein